MDDDASRGEPTIATDNEESKTDVDKAKGDDTQESDLDDDDNEELDELVSLIMFLINILYQFDLNVTMDLLNAPFKKVDEFIIFNEALSTLYRKDPQYINNLIAQLPDNDKKFLKEHTETKRVKIEHKGVETNVARRIIKVKRRGGVGSGAAGGSVGI